MNGSNADEAECEEKKMDTPKERKKDSSTARKKQDG